MATRTRLKARPVQYDKRARVMSTNTMMVDVDMNKGKPVAVAVAVAAAAGAASSNTLRAQLHKLCISSVKECDEFLNVKGMQHYDWTFDATYKSKPGKAESLLNDAMNALVDKEYIPDKHLWLVTAVANNLKQQLQSLYAEGLEMIKHEAFEKYEGRMELSTEEARELEVLLQKNQDSRMNKYIERCGGK